MPNQRAEGTSLRSLAVEVELWDAAKAKAAERGEKISEVILRKLREYLDEE